MYGPWIKVSVKHPVCGSAYRQLGASGADCDHARGAWTQSIEMSRPEDLIGKSVEHDFIAQLMRDRRGRAVAPSHPFGVMPAGLKLREPWLDADERISERWCQPPRDLLEVLNGAEQIIAAGVRSAKDEC